MYTIDGVRDLVEVPFIGATCGSISRCSVVFDLYVISNSMCRSSSTMSASNLSIPVDRSQVKDQSQ